MKMNRLARAIRQYLGLGVIIGALPNNIVNGQAIDAVPLMADLSFIIAQVNANAAPISSVPAFTAVTAFTPTVSFGGSSVGITYAVQAGAYVKIGSMVFFTLDVLLTNKGAAAGNALVDGLPFPVSASFPVGSVPVVSITCRNLTFAAGYISGIMSASSISVINPVTAATWNVLTNVAFANNTELLITGLYST